MTEFYYQTKYFFISILGHNDLSFLILYLFPVVLFLELPFYVITTIYAVRGWLRIHFSPPLYRPWHPLVSVVITAYGESLEEIDMSMCSIMEQIYPGAIEVLVIVDNATQNKKTVESLYLLKKKYQHRKNRIIKIIKKTSRGGHASSMNVGLKFSKGVMMVMLDADTSIDNVTVAKAVRHFQNENVIAVSGAVRVRNYKDSIIAKCQALEYMMGIQLGRFGLTEVNATNNLSGAFGIFRRTFLLRMGGWLNGTAEDLDMTLRIHAYTSRYPHLKIVNEPEAVSWTDAPITLWGLLKQRVRWDGDLYYIYVRRHWRKFSPKVMGNLKMLFISWYGLLYQLILPFVIIFYYLYLFLKFNLGLILVLTIMIYIYYLIMSLMQFATFLLLVSERPQQDSYFIGILFLMPAYQQFMRIAATFFILNEVLFKGHRDTSMAPWWVIRKTK